MHKNEYSKDRLLISYNININSINILLPLNDESYKTDKPHLHL